MAGTCSVCGWRQRSTRTGKAVLRAAGDRPVLGTFLDDRLDVLAEKVGYVEGSSESRDAARRPGRWTASQGLFDGLDETARGELRARSRPRVLPPGTVLCRAGDRSDSLYLVERGVLHVLDGGTAAPRSGITPAHELLARLDAAAAAGPVLLHVHTSHGDLAELLDYCDRTVAVLPADGRADAALAALLPGDVIRVEPTADPAWLGRRLARASVGIAFGGGGAKGWAHVGALRSLQRAGYVIDAVAGSSIGAWGRGVDGVGTRGGQRRAAAAGPLRHGRRAGDIPPRRRRRHRGDGAPGAGDDRRRRVR